MDLEKLVEDYVNARLSLGGCFLKIIGALVILIGIPVAIWQIVEKFLKDLDITWPMYMTLSLIVLTFLVGVAVYKRSEVNPNRNVGIVIACGSLALTSTAVMVFLFFRPAVMGIFPAILSLESWWITYRVFIPRKKKKKDEESAENDKT